MNFVMAFVIGATLSLLRSQFNILNENSKNKGRARLGLSRATITINWNMIAFHAIVTGLVGLIGFFIYTKVVG